MPVTLPLFSEVKGHKPNWDENVKGTSAANDLKCFCPRVHPGVIHVLTVGV